LHASQSLDIPGENLFLVARIGADVVGFGRVARVPAMPPPHAHVPQGWYLIGLVIDPAYRRRGIGSALLRARLAWIGRRAREAYYFANSTNRATIDLHERFNFREIARDFTFPRVSFTAFGGTGVLFRVDL
jgi:ribosomal protein S18 acetylase RimI-like enzyme